MEIIKALNELVYNDLVEYCNSQCIFIIPYVVSLFTHNMKNLGKRYRIIDYLIVNNPIVVYVMSAVIVVDEVTKLKAEYNFKKLKSTTFSFFGSEDAEEVPPLTLTDFYQRFQTLDFDSVNFEDYIEKTEKAMKSIDLGKIRKEFMSEKYQYEKYYPTIYEDKYLRDLTKCDDEKQKKIINVDIKDMSEDPVFNFLIKIYERLYGKKKSSKNDVIKKQNFTNLLFVGLSLLTLVFSYLIFKKMN
jgi:hypothetical protein